MVAVVQEEAAVLGPLRSASEVLQIDPELVGRLVREGVDVLVPEPKLSFCNVPEASCVFVPRAVEVDPRRDVAASLDDRPPALVRVHVAVHVNGVQAVRVGIYSVHAALVIAVVVYILAVSAKALHSLKMIAIQLRIFTSDSRLCLYYLLQAIT